MFSSTTTLTSESISSTRHSMRSPLPALGCNDGLSGIIGITPLPCCSSGRKMSYAEGMHSERRLRPRSTVRPPHSFSLLIDCSARSGRTEAIEDRSPEQADDVDHREAWQSSRPLRSGEAGKAIFHHSRCRSCSRYLTAEINVSNILLTAVMTCDAAE